MEGLVVLLVIAIYVAIAVGFYKWGECINVKNGRDGVSGGLIGLFGGLIGILILYLIGKK